MHFRLVSWMGFLACVHSGTALTTPSTTRPAAARTTLSQIGVPFVPNAGQWDSAAAFAAQTFAGTVFVSREGTLVYSLNARSDEKGDAGRGMSGRTQRQASDARGWVLTETLVDARQRPLVISPGASMPHPGKVNYVIGSDARRHRSGIGAYERVNLGEAYPGIDVQVRATGVNVEKIFTVAPRANVGQVRIRLNGAGALEIGSRGELIAHTGNGPVAYSAPIAYQEEASGRRTAVPVRYALNRKTRSYGFKVGAYDPKRPLVIDPLLQSAYIGGNSEDTGIAVAVHPITGEIYVAGSTNSSDFPKTAGAAQAAKSASTDGFITRLDASLSVLLQSTYLGGSGSDGISALAIHPVTGEIYAAGSTNSSDFPNMSGAAQATKSGNTDAFVTRFNPALTTVLQSTYLGGNEAESVTAFAIHPATGDAYVAGYTLSTDFPKVAGGGQPGKAALNDTFVARLNAALTAHLQSTYLGGNSSDLAGGIAIHPASGEVYVAGTTRSTDFPRTAGAEQSAHAVDGGLSDTFVTRFNAALTELLQSTYLGGNGNDFGNAVAISATTGEVYVAGYTQSSDFPTVAGSEQPAKGAGFDAYVTRLNAALTTRLQSAYIGGNGDDKALAMAIDAPTGEVYLTGSTLSTDFPKVAGSDQDTHAPDAAKNDVFITRLNAALTTRLQSAYLGGNGTDIGFGVAIHPATSEIYVAGFSESTDFPKVAGSEQVTGTGYDAFVSRMALGPAAGSVTVYEFFNVNLQHYFRTAVVAEANAIDNGAAGPGWQRTGLNFTAYAAGAGPGNDVCRFYNPVANTHFYTADPDECAQVRLPNSGWRYEELSFRVQLPVGGACPEGTIPVYRNYNNRFAFNDSNHRFTIDHAVYVAMIALGWGGEGIVMCARA